MFDGAGGTISVFPALDQGVEWCEIAILQVHREIGAEERPLVNQLEDLFQSSPLALRLMAYLDRIELNAGCDLVRQGTPADDFFLVESGSLSVQLDRSDEPRIFTIVSWTRCGRAASILLSHAGNYVATFTDFEPDPWRLQAV